MTKKDMTKKDIKYYAKIERLLHNIVRWVI